MRKIACLFAILVVAALPVISALPKPAAAIAVPPTTASSATPNIVITAFGGSDSLDFAELFNQSATPVNLTGWSLEFTIHDNSPSGCTDQTFHTISGQTGWLLSGSYFSFESGNGSSGNEAFFTTNGTAPAACKAPQLSEVQLLDTSGTPAQTIEIPSGTTAATVWQHWQRGNSSLARKITGIFDNDYKAPSNGTIACGASSANPITLCSSALYVPQPDNAGLQILEILPNARNCSPTDNTSPDCVDYVKLFNPSKSQTINLSRYRLRIGYKGQGISTANTFHFSQKLLPGKYFTLAARDDGEALSVPDSGDFVWLEDAEGVQVYDPVIQYPSASSSTKVGWAWAFDGTTWRWTPSPQPFGPNYFPPEATSANAATSSSLKPCAPNQYRNPATNRCKLIVSASTLVPCKPDQERNPETNRCRSILAASSALTPCKAGQERNPATNRCRSVLGASTSLKPCAAGWQRNPQTNRCRKIAAASVANVQDIKTTTDSGASGLHWLIAAALVIAALGYAIYEWRQEITRKIADTKAKLATLAKLKR